MSNLNTIRCLSLITNYSSEAEDHEPIDCKVEDQSYNIPSSPTWSSHTGSPTSPVENAFNSNSLYSLASGHSNGGSNVYGRSHTNERWPGQGQSEPLVGPNHRQDMAWSPSTSTLSSGHTMSRRREGSILQSENWSSINSQPNGRWQGHTHEPTNSSSGAYPDRPRIRPQHSYDEHQALHRRDTENTQHQQDYSVRYVAHPAATREGALQRLHWHTRDAPDVNRDLRRGTSQTSSSFSPSPTMPFSPQTYHTTPTYTSAWTSPDANLLNTPTLHPVSNQTVINYDGSYGSSTAISSPDEYAGVDDFHDS